MIILYAPIYPCQGISGPPGAGKSTFIEAFGSRLTGSVPWEPVNENPSLSVKGRVIQTTSPSSKTLQGLYFFILISL
ncbi:unnamed protein product [Protopolystoma xenopodis]|uniref:Uncharacterized protein n=1 Tax=Protopolystoma xenopodis TaxID=117903 RepID=A0A3S5ABS3_9PLAT|nr:unnamed protein product [Protopolystoma xenopodis]